MASGRCGRGTRAIAIGGDAGPVATYNINITYTTTIQADAVPLMLARRQMSGVFDDVELERFTGREWLVKQVEAFLASHSRGYVFIEGEAGVGKTAFAAWLTREYRCAAHFARQDRSVPVALQKLAAQLIDAYELAEFAPGRMLLPQVFSPSGFAVLLQAAAAKAAGDGGRLVLVVDGLDEAQRRHGVLPFGLPLDLPPGVFVVATYRTGIPPGEPEVDSTTLRLRADDPRNHADVRRFLNQAVAEERLAGRLAECGVPAAEFTEALAERCRGVWVYLRYVLREIRLGLRRPDDVDNLPTDLTGYYAKTLGADQHSPQWVEVHLPLLATLAAAREPLPAEALARLAGLPDTHAVQRLCDVRYRPLLTATGLPRTYAIYHASLREFLTGTLSTQPDTSLPDHLHALAATFAGATHAAHARIADHYLTRFGGLDTGLAALAADPALADLDDGYPLRHLAAHLDHAGQIEDLHRLLACERPTGSGSATNVWFDAHDRAGTLDRYLTDLDRARCQVEQETDARLRAGRQAPSLGLELRYVLMAASINSITSNVPIPLLERLVETGIWDTTRALTHARRLHEPSIRCNALVALLPRLSDDQRPAVVREALETAHAVAFERDRVEALEALAPHLSEELLRKALEIAHAITDEYFRVRALAALAPHLPGDQRPAVLREALETAHAVTFEHDRVEALEALAPHLSEELLRKALEIAHAITNEGDRVRALAALAPHLPDDQGPAVLVGLFREMSWANHFGSVLLEQACRFRQPDVDVIAIGFLRRSCWIKRRRECLALIRAAIPTIQACGGESAIHQLIRAMRKVQQWWP